MAQMTQVVALHMGDRIAQLLLLNLMKFQTRAVNRQGGFGSTGKEIFWEVLVNEQRPTIKLQIGGRPFEGLFDTGADVSVISRSQWPQEWPLVNVDVTLSGLGQTRQVYQRTPGP